MFGNLASFWNNFFGSGNPLIAALGDLLDDLKPASKFEGLHDLLHRRADGHNNDNDGNDSNDRGVHLDTFARLIVPGTTDENQSYKDGIGEMPDQQFDEHVNYDPNTDFIQGLLPSARDVSNGVMDQGTEDIPNSFGVNEFFQFFGQMLTHDMAEAALGGPETGDPTPDLNEPVALDGLGVIPFLRTPYETGPGGLREQVNEETSFLDLSNVYGNEPELLEWMRDDGGHSAYLLLGDDGMLPTISEAAANAGIDPLDLLAAWDPDNFGGLNSIDPPGPAGITDVDTTYFIGDNRVDQTPLLISQHLLWARNHNYWAGQIEEKHPDWTQDEIFEAARAMNEADWQHVVYEEYLVKLLGSNAVSAYGSYSDSVDPRIINEFSTVAFRFGHDQSSMAQTPLNEDGTTADIANFTFTLFTLAEAFQAGAAGITSDYEFASWLRGQLSAYSQEIDGYVVDGNRNILFGGPGGQVTDLEVLDIMRARDHGVWNYNDLREAVGLEAYETWQEFGDANGIDADRLDALRGLYGADADGVGNDDDGIVNLDSLIGGLLEAKFEDGQLGETFTRIVVTQFENLRDGDSMFYTTRLADEPELLKMIESTSLADIIERNSDIGHVYHDAFMSHNRIAAENGQLEGTEDRDLAIGSDYNDVIHTYGNDDDIYGGKAKDTIYAGAGNDLVNGEEGNDTMYGEEGYDTFVFEYNSGKDKVMDFNVLEDKIDVSGYHFASMGDVKDAMSNTWGGVILDFDDGNYVKIMGVKSYDLTADNFILDGHETAMA